MLICCTKNQPVIFVMIHRNKSYQYYSFQLVLMHQNHN